MMVLRTGILYQTLDSVSVAWSTGLKKNGIVNVHFQTPQAGNDLLAEFVAIRHLLFRSKVFDRLPITGEGYRFELSSIKPYLIVTRGRKTKNIVPFVRFLWSDMMGAKFDINLDTKWHNLVSRGSAIDIEFDKHNDAGLITFSTPSFGEIQVSPHAVQRYTERSADFMKAPRRSLMHFILKPGFKRTEMPESVKKHKLFRYGPHDLVETWIYPGTNNYFLLILKDSYKVLVTIYNPLLTQVKARHAEIRRQALKRQWKAEREAAEQPKLKRKIRVVL